MQQSNWQKCCQQARQIAKTKCIIIKIFFYGSTERYTSYFYREMNLKYRVQII